MSVGSLKVKIFDSKGTHVVPVAKSTATVGSAPHCDVVLEHSSVAAEHVRAWLEGGRIWVQDLGTPGGTSLNGIRLPVLKPMLVRDIDVLKLGECPATLGFEPNVVRAPVVKTQVAIEEITATDIKPIVPKDPDLEKRRDELAQVSRELAEAKLQLQMVRLEKSQGDDLRRDAVSAREELKHLNEQKQKLADTIERLEQEKQVYRRQFEAEISDLKLKGLREVKEARENELRKFQLWKLDVAGELTRQVHGLNQAKAKQWVTRPFSQDMVFEWEADMNLVFRRVILNDAGEQDTPPPVAIPEAKPVVTSTGPYTQTGTGSYHIGQYTEVTNTQKVSLPLEPKDEGGVPKAPMPDAVTGTQIRSAAKGGKAKSKSLKGQLRADAFPTAAQLRYAMIGLASAALVLGAFALRPYWRKMGARQLASQGAEAAPTATPTMPAAQVKAQPSLPPLPQAQPNAIRVAANPPPPARFEPAQTRGFKKSYTDNVLYTTSFIDNELSAPFRQEWLGALSKVAKRQWKLDDGTLNAVTAKELQLLQDLKRLREGIVPQTQTEGIAKMRAREDVYVKELQTLLRNKGLVDKFLRFKRGYYSRNSAK